MIGVMFDIETLDVLPTAVILSLCAVRFTDAPFVLENAHETDVLRIKINVDEQVALGRTISDSTMEFWAKQPPHIVEEQFSDDGRVSCESAANSIKNFCWGADEIWSHRFMDLNIIQHLLISHQMHVPWNFWQAKDSSTLLSEFKIKLSHDDKHDPLADCVSQIHGIQRVRKIIRSI